MHKYRQQLTVYTLCAVLSLLMTEPASALFMQSPSVPAERLITNISAYLEEKPEDPQAHFLLARVHYMAFIHRSTHVLTNQEGNSEKLPNIADPRAQHGKRGGDKIDEEQAVKHAKAAIASFNKAIQLDKDNAMYHLGLAGIYEQASPLAPQIIPSLEDEEDKDVIKRCLAKAVDCNLAAYKLDREAALKKNSVFLPFYPVAYEGGKAYLRLIKANELEPEDDKIVAQINDDLKAIDGKPKAITPIILRVEGDVPKSLDALLAGNTTVRFDLDADGTAEKRPWVNPDTAILVWDPERTGKITSGQQLFGNMTFFMLFSDGYRALDSLDDNRDGQLADNELKGLALWHDRNINGVSDPGEVTPIQDTPVRAIATEQTGKHGIHPMNGAGVTLDDGTTRPTWDWVIPAATD